MGQLTCCEFGHELLRLNDLDPVYVALWGAGLPRDALERWLLAYWCFYHVGTASWVTDQHAGKGYWWAMRTAAGSKDYPRSSERRHFRGRQALESVAWLRAKGLDALFGPLRGYDGDAAELIEYVRTWRGFGPWVSFKVADMVERLALGEVWFSAASVLYDSPRKAADVLWDREGRPDTGGKDVGEWAIGHVLRGLRGYKAPPRYERPLNAQEAETVLCKWGSYLNGHYEVGEDVDAVRTGLTRFDCPTARTLTRAGRKAGLWT